jgi:RIO kinase 1
LVIPDPTNNPEFTAYDAYVQTARDRRVEVRKQKRAPRFADPLDVTASSVDRSTSQITLGTNRAMTYHPARYEAVWLEASLRSFFEQELITDVLSMVKGGKEANVYRCAANARTGQRFLAAKVYRPRQFRNLSNDRAYREGRELATFEAGSVRAWHRRVQTALTKKTEFGGTILHTSWLLHEYTTLERLHRRGADVPRPWAANENTIVMEYLGDEQAAAPSLRELTLTAAEANDAFHRVIGNVEALLGEGLIHGDLSAYNVLYWQGTVCLIDFPQVVIAASNPKARWMFGRDLRRVCDYFARMGVSCDAEALADDLWDRHMGPSPDGSREDPSAPLI